MYYLIIKVITLYFIFFKIPAHFRSNWSSYQIEALTLIIIFFYIINYIYGKTRNSSIAFNWFTKNRILLEQQFALVGDNGISPVSLKFLLILT